MEKHLIITESNSLTIDAAIELKNLPRGENLCITVEQDQRRVIIELDPAQSVTTYSSIIYNRNDYRFSIHSQDIMQEMGKFFGGQDVVLGYPDFDKKFVVKTNEEQRTEDLFADAEIRAVLESLPGLRFGIVQFITETEDGKVPFLQLEIDGLIGEASLLQNVYNVFRVILLKVDI